MPDWALHLAAGAACGRAFRLRNLHVLLLGAILPDLAAALGVLSESNLLPLDPYLLLSLALPIGAPFGVACLCLFLALWMNKPLPAFSLLFLGALLHYLLDVFQTGHVEFLLYPYSFAIFNWPRFHYASPFLGWLGLLALLLLAILRFFPLPRDIRFSAKYAGLSLLPLLLLALVIGVNASRLLPENKFNLQFLLGEPLPENTPVQIYAGRVVARRPLIIKKMRRQIEVLAPAVASPPLESSPAARPPTPWPASIRPGQFVYVQGRFSHNRLLAETVVPLATGRKTILSLFGLFVLIIYWLPIPFFDRHAQPKI